MESKPKLSVVAPAYNEEQGISQVVYSWIEFLELNEPDYEIVICDDGSKDNTWKALEHVAQKNLKVRNVKYVRNQGAAAALACAVEHTVGDLVLFMDSDGQFSIEDYLRMKDKLSKAGADAVIGYRKIKENSILTRAGSALSGWVANFFLGSNIRDFNSAFKLIKGDLARSLLMDGRGLVYSTDVTAKLLEQGVKIAQIPIIHKERIAGTSSLKIFNAALTRFRFTRYLIMRRRLIKAGILRRVQHTKGKVVLGQNSNTG